MTIHPPQPPPQSRPSSSAASWVVGAILALLIAAVTVAGALLVVQRHHEVSAGARATHGRQSETVAAEQPDYAVIERAASESAVALLSYESGTVRQTLTKAIDCTTGAFRDSYTKLINDVVIPAAEQQRITSTATIPAVGVAEADAASATTLVFIDQTITTGSAAPNSASSSVRMHLVKIGGRWLVDRFEPV